ncbi:MAG TPA: hypothetical protein VFU43_19975 [Streptosporangiaceae bacterium]|nr:hypothetical protein [Streptosporangiaceae bacterium]
MTFDSSRGQKEDLARKAEKISRLQELIQEYPAEAQLIMSAIEDGLTLGPIQVMDRAVASASGLSWAQ